MKNKSFLNKFILTVVLLTVASTGFSIFSFKKALAEDKEIKSKVEAALKDKFKNKDLSISFLNISSSEKESSDQEDLWNLRAGDIKSVTIEVTNSDVKILPAEEVGTDKSTLLIKAKADRNKNFTGKIFLTELKDGVLTYKENDKASLKSGQIEITLPQETQIKFLINEVNGDVKISKVKVEEIKINTVNSDVEIKEAGFKNLSISSVNSDIVIETLKDKTSNNKSKTGYKLKLSTISGDIEKNIDSSDKSENTIEISTVNGDVKID